MRPEQEMARLIRRDMEYSADRRLRDRMWTVILATHKTLQQETTLASRRVSAWEIVMRSRTIQIAVAAVLTIGLVLLTHHSTSTEQTQQAQQDLNPVQPPSPELLLRTEMETARRLFARQDLAGLTQLLATGQDATKAQIAVYLGQIGNGSTLSALQTLAAQWQGSPQDNPFLKAIAAIQERQAKTQPVTTAPAPEPNGPPAPKVEAPKSPANSQTGISGRVVDKLTQKPVQSVTVQRSLNDPATATRTDEAGQFVLTGLPPSPYSYVHIMAKGYVSQRIIPHVVANQITRDLLIELDHSSRVQGTVTDPDGKPISGATAKTFYFTNVPSITDKDGWFEIDGLNPVVDRYSLEIIHPDYPAVSVEFSPGAIGEIVQQNIVLKPGADVFGQVTGPDGKPVEGVQVGNTMSRSMWNCISTATDHEGKYRLHNVDIGDFILWAAHSRYALHVDRTTIEAGTAQRQMDIRLQAPTPLHGKVVDDANEPVPGIRVSVQEYNGVSNLTDERPTSDANGLFVIANAPAEGHIVLNPFGEGISGALQEFELGQQEYVLKVHRAGRIYGRVVTDTTGEPVPEFTVKLTFSEVAGPSSSYVATWNREGYSFKSPEGLFDTGEERLPVGGNYKMTVLAQGFDALTLDPVHVQAITDDPNRTMFRLKPMTMLAGVVVDERGNPIKDAVIAMFSKGEQYEPMYWRQSTTDADGVFVVTGVGNDEELMYVTAPGFASHSGRKSELETEDGKPARIVLSVGGRIFGQVLDEKGRPLKNVRVRVNKSPEPNEPYPIPSKDTRTDMNGYYELSSLPTGRLWVAVELESGQNRTNRLITLSPGESLQIDFGNEGGFALTGIVRRGPTPVVGATVDVSVPEGDSKSAGTDKAGRFHLSGIPAGQVHVTITGFAADDVRQRRSLMLDRRTVQVQGDTDVDIDLGSGSISGHIPEPFKGRQKLQILVYRLTRQPLAEQSSARPWTYVPKDPQIDETSGRFTCPDLCADTYYLALEDDLQVLGITDVLTLREAEHKQDVVFRFGRGQLSVRVVDARTGQGVSGAQYGAMNDLGHGFIDRRSMSNKSAAGMTTDSQGKGLCQELPPGQYEVYAWARGYLSSTSGFVAIRGDETQPVMVPLQPAATAAFELSPSLRKRVDTDSIMITCRVTDLRTQLLVPFVIGRYRSDEHRIVMSLQNPDTDVLSLLHVPEGRYRVDYELTPFDTVGHISKQPVHKGTVTAELATGQTKSILLDDQ